MDNDYLLTIRLTTPTRLDPEAVGRIEAKVMDLLRNPIWEASGATGVQAHLWSRQDEGGL